MKIIVPARNLHFCLACNLIQPLGSTHNFTQSGWLILFNPNHLSGQHKLGKSAKHFSFCRTTLFCTDVYCLLSNSSSMASWGKQSNSWTPWLFFFDQGFPVEYGLDTFNTPHTGTTLCHPQNWLCRLRCRIPLRQLALISPLGNIFWRHACFSPKQPEPQNHGDFNVYFLKQQTWLLLHMANISPSYVQQCLKITIHLSSRHLATKILSPLYHYFFPFLQDLQHKRKLYIPCCH